VVECPARSTRTTTATRDALGWLAIYLLGRDLPEIERRFCWALMQAWLAELVDWRLEA